MGHPTRFPIALALVALVAASLGACGGSDADLLPGETAHEITANLNMVKRLAAEGDCVGAESAAQQVSEQIASLGGVDARLKRALRDGATRLREVVTECEEATTEAIAPAETPAAEGTGREERDGQRGKKPKGREGGSGKAGDEADEPESSPPPSRGQEGEGQGNDGGGQAGGEGEGEVGSPSGGVSPGSPVGEGE